MNQRHDERINDADLLLSDKTMERLGPNLILDHCRIIINTTTSALVLTKVEFHHCYIETKKRLTNFQKWCNAIIEDCTFTGRFVGNDFGHWQELSPDGRMERCDFSGAVLDGCRLMNCDMSAMMLPRWRCFTILNPAQRRAEIDSFDWPDTVRPWADAMLTPLEIAAGVTWHAPTRAKEWGTTEEELKLTVQQLGGVIL